MVMPPTLATQPPPIVFQILTYIPGGAESSIPIGPTLLNFVKAFYIPFTYVYQVLIG